MAIFAFSASVCAGVFWAAQQQWTRGFFRFVPPIVLIIYIPSVATALGVIPASSLAFD
jgi:hypothetical protein